MAANHSGLGRKTGSDDVTEGGLRALMCQSKENLLDLTQNVESVDVALGRKKTRRRVGYSNNYIGEY